MYLKEMIEKLEAMNQDAIVDHGLHNPHSYRGYYSELAFEPCDSARVGDMLKAAKGCIGKTFTGWKGGEFMMNEYTEIYIAQSGGTGQELTDDRFLIWARSEWTV